MAHKIFIKDTITDACGFADPICPTVVVQGTGPVTVTDVSTPGNPAYEVSVTPHTVDINVSNFAYDPVTKILTITETDGSTHPVDLSDLVDTDVVTTLSTPGGGIIRYVNEDGTVVDVSLCDVLGEYPDVGPLQCALIT